MTDPQNVVAGNTVQLDAGYDTVKYSVGGTGTTPTNSTVNPGDVVDDSGTLYRYIGSSPLTGVDFSTGATPPDFTDTSNWAKIGGTTGDTYQYVGPSNGSLDINNQDYTNGSLWTDITGGSSSAGSGTSSLPAGVVATLGAGLGFLTGGSNPTTPPKTEEGATDPDGAANPDEAATPDEATEKPADESGSAASGEGTEGDGGGETSVSVSAAGVYTENKIATSVTASVSNTASITTGSGSHNGLSVTASDTATISSFDGAAAVSADFSDESGDSVTIGISIARNTIQNTVSASVEDAGQINAPNAPVTIEATQASTIQATSLAAALSIAVGGENGLGVAGGGSLADNLIGTNTTATLSGTDVGTSGSSAGALTVDAADTSTIDAEVAAFAGNVTFGSEDGTGVGIGASLAHNRIGDGTDTGSGAVTASITDSSIFSGAIDVNATSQQDITATVAAVAVALSGGGESAVGVSGAGAFSFNEVAVSVSATIDGGSTDSITSHGVTVAAADTSTIEATVLAGSVAGGFGGEDSTDVAIGVSFARNSITDPVTASISNIPSLLTNGGAVSVTAQEGGTIDAVSAAVALSIAAGGEDGIAVAGGGALAANFIDATTQAFISGTNLGATGHLVGAVTVSATDDSLISATIAAIAASAGIGGESGIGVAIGVSLAYNEIGDATGFGSGEVKADISGGSVDSSGLVSVAAASNGAISATTVAVAAALSGGGETGVGVAGAGVGVFNTISVDVSAYIDGGGTHSVASDGVSVCAADTARITSLAGAAAVSASFGGEAGISVAIGLSIAGNIITDPVTAYITGVSELTTSGAAVSVTAGENATIHATTVAAALSVAAGGEAGIAVAGGGAVAVNLVGAETSAYISNSTLGQTGHLVGGVTVTATDDSDIEALVGAVAASISFGGEAGVGVAIGVAYAHNLIGNGTESGAGAVTAYLSSVGITGTGLVDVEANASETIEATTVAAAVALSGGGEAGIGVSGAGVGVTNQSQVDISAYIDGGNTASIAAGSVKVAASDSSTISAIAGAAAIAAGFGGEAGVAVSIGLSIATNQITDPVTAYINDVPLLTTAGGAVTVTATESAAISATSVAAAVSLAIGGAAGVAVAGGGASAENIIGAVTEAYISGSTLGTTGAGNQVGAITVKAKDTSSITAFIGAVAAAVGVGGEAGVGVAIGVSIAFNRITDGTFSGTGEVEAYMLNTPINATGLVDIEATSSETISAITAAGAVGISGGGAAGVGVHGRGALPTATTVAVDITADINAAARPPITTGGLTVAASDTSSITGELVGAAKVGRRRLRRRGRCRGVDRPFDRAEHDRRQRRGVCYRRRLAVEWP